MNPRPPIDRPPTPIPACFSPSQSSVSFFISPERLKKDLLAIKKKDKDANIDEALKLLKSYENEFIFRSLK